MRDSLDRLTHIYKAIAEIEAFTKEVSKDNFTNDNILSSAVLFQFSVIGEAVSHLDQSIIDKYEYQWYKVRSFRNLISHEYFNIKLEAVWEIIENDLPGFKQLVETIVKSEI